jgi:hypothetical protein
VCDLSQYKNLGISGQPITSQQFDLEARLGEVRRLEKGRSTIKMSNKYDNS